MTVINAIKITFETLGQERIAYDTTLNSNYNHKRLIRSIHSTAVIKDVQLVKVDLPTFERLHVKKIEESHRDIESRFSHLDNEAIL